MTFRAEIPYGAYWSTPFARWQGSLAHLHSVQFAAHVAKAELARRGIAPERIDHGVLGLSVPQPHAFYGLPWLAGMAGAGKVAGPTIMQACATRGRVLLAAAQDLEARMADVARWRTSSAGGCRTTSSSTTVSRLPAPGRRRWRPVARWPSRNCAPPMG